jgi:hypothetical protein
VTPAEWDRWAPFSIRPPNLWDRVTKTGCFEAALLHPKYTGAAEPVMVDVRTHQALRLPRDMGPSTAALLFHPGKQPELSILGTQHSPLHRWKFLKQHAMRRECQHHVTVHKEEE